jgi:hypothetical protein
MKRVVILLIFMLIITGCSEEKEDLDIMGNNRALCNINQDFQESKFYKIGDSLSLQGENCSISFQLESTSYDSVKIKIFETVARFKEVEIKTDEPYLTDYGVNIFVVSSYDNGARLVFSKELSYDKNQYYDSLKKCFGDLDCQFTCEEMDGVIMDECDSLTVDIDKTFFKSKFFERNCCVNKPQKYMVLPSKNTYYAGENLRVFFFGPTENNCVLSLISREGKEFSKPKQNCKPFSQILGEDLLSNYGQYFGKWNLSLKLDTGYRKLNLSSQFNYEDAILISKSVDLDKGSKETIDFYSDNFSIEHIKGCTQNVKLVVNNNPYSLNLGHSIYENDVNIILKGASCKTKAPIKLLFQVPFVSVCNNGLCEGEETSKNCPWDCLKNNEVNITYLDTSSKCSKGCYFDKKCLNSKTKLIWSKKVYECKDRAWV